jgi:hypothetical protein
MRPCGLISHHHPFPLGHIITLSSYLGPLYAFFTRLNCFQYHDLSSSYVFPLLMNLGIRPKIMDIPTRYFSLRPNNGSHCPQSGMAGCLAPAYPFFGLVDTSHYFNTFLNIQLGSLTSMACIQWRETLCYSPHAMNMHSHLETTPI